MTAVLAVLFLVAGCGSSSGAPDPWIGVRGNHLVDGDGQPVRLLGVNRPGTEYQCVEGGAFFEGPSDRASIGAMKSWDITQSGCRSTRAAGSASTAFPRTSAAPPTATKFAPT